MTMSRPCSLQMPCPEDDPMAMRRARQAASETTFAEATCGTSHEIELSSTFPVRQSPEPSADFDITQSSTSTIYARLPDARSYIRLLKFQTPQTFNSTAVDVCCVLQTFPLAQLPPYKAISYTWGPEEPTAAIRIDDYLRDVRLNCETVLRRVRQQDAASFYWIDAVCIDQRNLDEKGHQVALMGKVFGTAHSVISYVGEHANDSQFLCRKLQENGELFKRLSRKWSRLDHGDKFLAKLNFFRISYNAVRRMLIAFRVFLKRRYFRRVWICQELFLGQKVYVQCGEILLPMEMFHGIDRACYIWRSMNIQKALEWAFHSENVFYSLDIFGNDLLFAGCFQPDLMSLDFLIGHVIHYGLDCHDLLDKVYGVLALVDWGEEEPLLPDYTKDVFELGLELVSKMKGSCRLPLFTFATSLVSVFKLFDAPSRMLKRAIQTRKRRDLVSVPTKFATDTEKLFSHISPQSPNWKNSLWTGFCLARDETGGWVYPFSTRQTTVLIAFKTIYLPPIATPGDWCLFSGRFPNVVVIVREHPLEHHFWIIGKGLCEHFGELSKVSATSELGYIWIWRISLSLLASYHSLLQALLK